MFAIERQRMIKNLLLKNRHVTVTQLSDCMNVSEVTIRRDLEKLEEEQFLMRTHGGAVIRDLSGANAASSPAAETIIPEENHILAMAKLASNMIHDSNIVYLGNGSITAAISQALGNKQDLIVLTCSILTAAALYKNRNIQVILPGGTVLPNGMLYGPNVRRALDTMHMGISFIEVSGFDNNGFTFRDQETCSLIHQISRMSDHLVFLCPAQAYGRRSVFKLGDLSMAHSIITTPDIDPAFNEACAKHNITLFTAYEE